MPSNKILEAKKQVVETLAEKIKSSQAGVLVKYEGIKVSEDTELRAALRKAGVEYTVMKNTLTGKACEIAGYGDMKQYLEGTIFCKRLLMPEKRQSVKCRKVPLHCRKKQSKTVIFAD